MKKVLRIAGIILLILIIGASIAWFGFLKPEPPPVSEEDRAAITLMPLPAELKLGKGELSLDHLPEGEFTDLRSPRLDRALERFTGKLALHTGLSKGEHAPALVLTCLGDAQDYPALGDDESYEIEIKGPQIMITAPAETGIIYGLESILQLVRQQDGGWVIPHMRLRDQPRYPWRGLMVDVCRHWIPKDVILRNLEAMGTVKMNVLHWHLTEYQGFRVESKVFPKLHGMGSGGNYYSQDEIREVVEFAADRGIRVVPEFDLPGHATSWFAGYPELASAPGPYTPDTTFGVLDPVLDPTREEVYEFMDAFFGEMAGLFPDDYLHIGGDEVSASDWDNNADIQAFMQKEGLDDHHALQAYLNRRLHSLLEGHGKQMMGWDEIIHPELPDKGLVVQTWRDQSSLWESARMGHAAILSAGYYLDYKQPAAYHYAVDPAIIPGAVNIEVDSANWRAWNCSLHMSEMDMEGTLFLFGEGEEMRGIMDFMGTAAGLPEVEQENDKLSFDMKTNFGSIRFETNLKADSIVGNAKLSMFTLELNGVRTGGSDMTGGIPLPEFKKIEPLSPGEETRLLGGEACMWTEMADARTLESRIWPRAAAIGEKLWSPQVLTGNIPDMYRRLMDMDERLERSGLQHNSYREVLLQDIVQEPYLAPLKTLTALLEEDRFFNRMSLYDPFLYTTTPLNRMVDAAAPESYKAFRFGQDVDAWIASGDEAAKARLKSSMQEWLDLHASLEPAFTKNPRLTEVEPHATHLTMLAEAGLRALNDPAAYALGPIPDSLLAKSAEAYGGTLLAPAPHVQKLLARAAQK